MKVLMRKKTKNISMAVMVLFFLWLIPLGFHIYIADYSNTNPIEPIYTRDQLIDGKSPYHVYVYMEPEGGELGIPFLFMVEGDLGPPCLRDFVIMVDGHEIESESFVLESLVCRLDNGKEYVIVDTPKTGMLSENTFFKSEIREGQLLKETRISLPQVIKKRDSYDIKYKGHFTGSDKPIEGVLRMDYSWEFDIYPGWFAVMVMLSGV